MNTANTVRLAISSILVGALALQGCTPAATQVAPSAPPTDTAAAAPNSAATAASVADLTGPLPAASTSTDATATPAYAPPTAAQLIQLLAPVAVFPDTLVAQVLAASAHPEQIGTAYAWYQRNNGLKGSGLQNAIDRQDWDASVKAIASFPDVLHQMASNLPWTTALGEAYINDPSDVMNAIQSLRQQAMACNNLKSNQYLKVSTLPKTSAPPTAQVDEDAPPTYAGPAMIPAPQQIIEIAPAQPDYVYVPQYDPNVFYGTPIVTYPGYAYAWPAPIYAGPLFGAFGFGLGIGIDFGHPWGWGRWGVQWGPGFGRPGYGYGFHGPAVVYNNRAYFAHSTTIVNHFAARSPANFTSQAALHAGMNPSARFAATAGSHPGNDNFRAMSTPHFASSMATHTSTLQASRLPSSSGVSRPGELPSAHFAPAAATHAGMSTSPAVMHPTPTRSPVMAQSMERGTNAQTAASHVQSASLRSVNSANGQHYSTQPNTRGYAPRPASSSFGNAQHALPRVAQGPRSVPHATTVHATNVSHGGGRGESARHR